MNGEKRKFIPRIDEQTLHPTQFIITLKRKLVLWFVPQKIGIEFSVVLLFVFIYIVNQNNEREEKKMMISYFMAVTFFNHCQATATSFCVGQKLNCILNGSYPFERDWNVSFSDVFLRSQMKPLSMESNTDYEL